MYHDTHAHLDLLLQRLGDLPDEKDLDLEKGTLKHIEDFEVDKKRVESLISKHDFVIHPTVSTDNFYLVSSLFRSISKIYFLLGSHPEIVNSKFSVEKYIDEQQTLVVELESDQDLLNRLVGIGEAGLDYHYTKDPLIIEKQKGLFEEQISLAIKLKLPLIIHCREAFADLFTILKQYPDIHGNFLIHCFTGDTDDLQKVLEFDGKVAFGGVATFNSAVDLQDAVKYCPNDSFVLETDLPFLAPAPYRSQICMPEMIDEIAQKISELKSLTKKEVWNYSLKNSINLFGQL